MSLLAGCKGGLGHSIICSPQSVKLRDVGLPGGGRVDAQLPPWNGVARLGSRAGWKLFSAVA